jgi:phage terminase large subunit
MLCIREHQVSLKQSSKQLIEDKARKLGVGHKFYPTREHVGVEGGGVILFQGAKNHTVDSIKSFEAFDVCWVEEGQAISATSWKMITPTLRKPGSEIWVGWNPNLPDDPVDVFFRKEKHPRAVVVQANYMDNPWFGETELVDDMEHDKRTDADRYEHVWLGGYNKKSNSRVFNNWRVGTHEEFEKLRASRYYFGADWGFSIDPSVLVRMHITGRDLYIDREAYKIGCEIDFTPFLFAGIENHAIRKVNEQAYSELKGKVSWKGIEGAMSWPITADSARPETIKYMQKHGFPRMRKAVKGPNSVQEGVEFLRTFNIIVHPDCAHTIDELTMYSYKVDEKTDEVLPVLEDKKNHVIDACRYAVEPLRRATMGLH